MAEALTEVHARLVAKEQAQREEEKELDRQLGEYDAVMDLVSGGGQKGRRKGDGGDGGFKQVIADMASVRREIEDCKKDLRRLGWTAD